MSQTIYYDMPPAMGADIGNGFASAALLEGSEAQDPIVLLSNELRRSGMPTDAYISDKREITVLGAEDRILRCPWRSVHAIKHHMEAGEKITLTDGKGKKIEVAADDVYAAIARDLLTMANRERTALRQPTVARLVLTYPVQFRDRPELLARMKRAVESIETGSGGHYEVIARLPEPVAAAFDYLYYMLHLAPEDRRISQNRFTALVYDLGHGTFDSSIVSAVADSDEYTVHASEGLPDVGGRNFDEIILNEFLHQLEQQSASVSSPASVGYETLRRLAVRAKHELSDKPLFEDDATFMVDGEYASFTLTRARFEELSRGLLDQTLMKTDRMLRYAKEHGVKIDAIVLCGGSSVMPMVKQNLEELARRDGIRVEAHRPSSAVSFGAARYARQCVRPDRDHQPEPGSTLSQKAEYAFGVSRQQTDSIYDEIVFLMPPDAVLPARSKPIDLRAERSGLLTLVIARSRQLGREETTSEPGACWELIRFTFELSPMQACTARFIIGEDRSITAELTTPDGKTHTRSTDEKKEKSE